MNEAKKAVIWCNDGLAVVPCGDDFSCSSDGGVNNDCVYRPRRIPGHSVAEDEGCLEDVVPFDIVSDVDDGGEG